MRKYVSEVQLIKYQVLREVARLTYEGTLEKEKNNIALLVDPGPDPRIRCCIYKERAITNERVKLAMGGDKNNHSVIEVLPTACDECPIDRFVVSDSCRGCLAHKCIDVCPVKGAIYFIGRGVYINQKKCIECGRCKEACPFNAITDRMRPCKRACPTDALTVDQNRKAKIDYDKCIQCGLCIVGCPFGAIMDRSSIVEVIELLEKSRTEKDSHVYAVIAPSIASQFDHVKIGQVVKGIKLIGFHDVVEVALGADFVAYKETLEFEEVIRNKKVLTSSCCPAFVSLIHVKYPALAEKISSSVSPMIAVSKLIKHLDKKARIVFVGPCVAKKGEIFQKDIIGIIDYVLTFEELSAIIDAKKIKIEECEEELFDNASYFGRIFARTGGLSEAIKHVIESEKIDVDFKPISCDGVEECEKALKKARVNRLDENFIEGMVCRGGCIGGAASLYYGPKDKKKVDEYGKLALEKGIKDSLRIFDINEIDLHRKISK